MKPRDEVAAIAVVAAGKDNADQGLRGRSAPLVTACSDGGTGLLRSCGAGARIEHVGRTFEDVELDFDDHQVIARRGELLLGLDHAA